MRFHLGWQLLCFTMLQIPGWDKGCIYIWLNCTCYGSRKLVQQQKWACEHSREGMKRWAWCSSFRMDMDGLIFQSRSPCKFHDVATSTGRLSQSLALWGNHGERIIWRASHIAGRRIPDISPAFLGQIAFCCWVSPSWPLPNLQSTTSLLQLTRAFTSDTQFWYTCFI